MRRVPLILALFLLLMMMLIPAQRDMPSQQALYKYYFPIAVKGWPSKKGLAMYPGSPCRDALMVGASWQYGWWSQPAQCDGVEDVPMVSCGIDASMIIGGMMKIGGDSDWFMLYNEPDLILPITPDEGAILYHRLLPIIGNRKVVAPAPSELNIEWLPEFRQAYVNIYGELPQLDALAAHCYKQSAAECEALVGQFIVWADEWGIGEVWVTEFSFTDLAEARRFIAWIEGEPTITRYAWYTNRLPATHIDDAPLIEWSTGHLTAWGVMYSGR